MKKDKSLIIILLVWIAIITAIFIGSTNSLFHISGKYNLDKIAHFSMYTVAAIIPAIIICSNRTIILVGIILGLFGALIEVIQAYIPGRTFSYEDMLANFIGVAIGITIGILLKIFVFKKACPRK